MAVILPVTYKHQAIHVLISQTAMTYTVWHVSLKALCCCSFTITVLD